MDNLFLFYLKNQNSLSDVYPKIPEGWIMDPYTRWLYKDNILRGALELKEISSNFAIFEMELFTRYNVDCFAGNKKVCVFDYDKSIIKEIGTVEDMWSEECEKLIEQGRKWLDENYPEWRDPTKYWDD